MYDIMVERDEERIKEEQDREMYQKILQDYRSAFPSRTKRRLANASMKFIIYTAVVLRQLSDKEVRENMKDPEVKGMLFGSDEYRTGLLEGAMFENMLSFPNKEDTFLETQKSVAGRFVGYDHFRADEFGVKVLEQRRQVKSGKLYVFPLEAIINNSPETYTPTGYLRIFDLDHFLQIQTPTISELIEYGIVKESTYAEAYKRFGLYDKYHLPLTLKNLVDKPVYTITPKGNGLVFLSHDGGSPMKFKKKSPAREFSNNELIPI